MEPETFRRRGQLLACPPTTGPIVPLGRSAGVFQAQSLPKRWLLRVCVLHGQSFKCLSPPRNTNDRNHPQSTHLTVNRHTSQTSWLQAPGTILKTPKGQPRSQDAQHPPRLET